MKCCVEDVESLSNSTICTNIKKKGRIIKKQQFDHKKCEFIRIPGAPHQDDNLSYEDVDPDICYKIIIYNGNKMSV